MSPNDNKVEQRVLIVDDTQKNIQVIGALLRDKGYLISVANSGENALANLEKSKPDLILLDIMMPGIDGYETCSRIKSIPETKDIPIIFLSAMTGALDKVKAFELGGVDYVTKPIESKELLARVETHLKIDALKKELKFINKNLEHLVEMRTKELKQTQSYLTNVIESMPSSIIGIDLDGLIINVNQEVGKEVPSFSGKIEGAAFTDVFSDYSEYYPHILEAFKDKKNFSKEKIKIETNSKSKYINLYSYPLMTDDEVVGGVIRLDDVTETLKYERLKSKFEKEKMAALGNIVIGVAHEINTPLGGVLTAASGLKQKTVNLGEQFKNRAMKQSDFEGYLSSAEEFEDLILSNAERAAGIVSNFKQIAVDYEVDEIISFKLIDLINTSVQTVHDDIESKKCTVNIDCPEDLQVKLQLNAINQVLGNLLTNSLTHGFGEKERCEINVRVEQDSDLLIINYSDNGKGIAKEDQDMIFVPFYTTKRGSECIGLGLSIVYNLITIKMKGNITFENIQGEGLSYRIELPQQW